MIAGVVHAMVAAHDEEGGLEMGFGFHGGEDLLDDGVHFLLFGDHVGAGGERECKHE